MKCISELLQKNIQPFCKRPKGCEIESLATDAEITRICLAFNKSKILLSQGHNKLAEQILENAGISDPDLVILLEEVFAEYQTHQRNVEISKKKAFR